jgi:hypothetical protein
VKIEERDALIALYDSKKVKPDSKLSHNLMRDAVQSGRLWIVKYLVGLGTPTRNLPCYGNYKWNFDSLQLTDILKKPHVRIDWKKSDCDEEIIAGRQNVQDYLVENDLI